MMQQGFQNSDEDIRKLKTAFAEALLRTPDDPFKAAFSVISDTGVAMQVARLWVKDSFVIEEQTRLTGEHGAKAFLPTKEEQARDVYKLAMNEQSDLESRLKAHRLYAEIMGNIEKPNNNINVNTQINQGVMIVRDHGSDDDWEQKAIVQQAKLIQDAATC